MAADKGLPASIHCREACDDVVEVICSVGNPAGGVIHCFSGAFKHAETVLELGYYIGVGGTITFPKGGALRDALWLESSSIAAAARTGS